MALWQFISNTFPRRSNLHLLMRRPGLLMRAYRLPLTILLVGATVDAVTTLVNLRRYGLEIEVHIVQRWVSQIFGVWIGVPLAKLIQLMFVVFVACWWRPWCGWIMGICGVLYGMASLNNWFLWL